MGHAANTSVYPVKAARRDVYEFEGRAVIGAAGAVASQDVDNPATTITLGTTGQYLLTFPNAKKGRLYWGFVSAAGTIEIAHLTAFDPAAGTATLLFKNDGGTATAPAEGDQFWFLFRADSRVD
jgi:hypothetical protein